MLMELRDLFYCLNYPTLEVVAKKFPEASFFLATAIRDGYCNYDDLRQTSLLKTKLRLAYTGQYSEPDLIRFLSKIDILLLLINKVLKDKYSFFNINLIFSALLASSTTQDGESSQISQIPLNELKELTQTNPIPKCKLL